MRAARQGFGRARVDSHSAERSAHARAHTSAAPPHPLACHTVQYPSLSGSACGSNRFCFDCVCLCTCLCICLCACLCSCLCHFFCRYFRFYSYSYLIILSVHFCSVFAHCFSLGFLFHLAFCSILRPLCPRPSGACSLPCTDPCPFTCSISSCTRTCFCSCTCQCCLVFPCSQRKRSTSACCRESGRCSRGRGRGAGGAFEARSTDRGTAAAAREGCGRVRCGVEADRKAPHRNYPSVQRPRRAATRVGHALDCECGAAVAAQLTAGQNPGASDAAAPHSFHRPPSLNPCHYSALRRCRLCCVPQHICAAA